MDGDAYEAGQHAVTTLTIPEIIQLFDDSGGGVACGGTATTLRGLYEWWGLTAWATNIGFHPDEYPGGYSHMEAPVRIDVDDSPMLTLHDSSINRSYSELDGSPLSYYEMLARLARHEADDVWWVGPTDGDQVNPLSPTVVFADLTTGMEPDELAATHWTIDVDVYTWFDLGKPDLCG